MRLEKDERFIVHLEKVDDYSSVVINVPRKEITIIDRGGTCIYIWTNIPVHYTCMSNNYCQTMSIMLMCVNSFLL